MIGAFLFLNDNSNREVSTSQINISLFLFCEELL